jgi:oligogalacturonide transport system permease protein
MSDANVQISTELELKNKELYRKRTRKRRINLAIRYTILILFAFIMLYPILWLAGSTFKTNAEIWTEIKFWPNKIDFKAYIDGWQTKTGYTFTTYFANTFKIVIPKVLFTAVSCTITAYGFARFNFRFKKVMFAALISTLFLPQVVLRIPMYIAWNNVGVRDSITPLVLPSLFAWDAFFVFMIIQFFRGIPRELDEAATVDGCGSFRILISILLPVLKPTIISASLLQFMWTMNDFMGPLIYISSVEKYPVAIALRMAIDNTGGTDFNWNQVLAMSLISIVPSVVVFFSAQRYFIDGIATSGLKG